MDKDIVFVITFIVFFIEALLHYNIGKVEKIEDVRFPDRHEFIEIVTILFIFSWINTYVINWFKKR